MLVTIDPGIRHVGVALFAGELLIRAALVRSPCTRGNGAAECLAVAWEVAAWVSRAEAGVDHVGVEWPRIYTVEKSKGDPNDLLALVGVGTAIGALLAVDHELLPDAVTSVHPDEWKGQVPKATMTRRILDRLSPAERALIEDAGTLTHNVVDAVGIGLHTLGRLERRRVIAR